MWEQLSLNYLWSREWSKSLSCNPGSRQRAAENHPSTIYHPLPWQQKRRMTVQKIPVSRIETLIWFLYAKRKHISLQAASFNSTFVVIFIWNPCDPPVTLKWENVLKNEPRLHQQLSKEQAPSGYHVYVLASWGIVFKESYCAAPLLCAWMCQTENERMQIDDSCLLCHQAVRACVCVRQRERGQKERDKEGGYQEEEDK